MAQEIPTPFQLLGRIGKTDEYLAHAAEAHSDADYETRRIARARGIGGGALKLAAEHTAENGNIDIEGRLFKLIATLEPFLQASLAIEKDKQHNTYVREEHLDDIGNTIDFNTALRELIDYNPQLTPTNIKEFLHSAFIASYGSKDAEFFMQSVNICLIGMQHEIGFEQIINHVPGATYRQSTKKEELATGGDMFVEFDGITFPIDIKSSEQKAKKMNLATLEFGAFHSYKIWSHAATSEFNGTFRLPYDLVVSRAKDVKEKLREGATLKYKKVA
jgi:hypothetical protein